MRGFLERTSPRALGSLGLTVALPLEAGPAIPC